MSRKSLLMVATTLALGGTAWAADDDGDGIDAADDCDDADATVFPGAPEACNTRDDDCDGAVDEEQQRWFLDRDGDGYGVASLFVDVCRGSVPAPAANGTWTLRPGDCFDSSAAISPGRDEVCDGLDNDCNGLINDGIPERAWHPDDDGDGFGDADEGRQVLASCAPAMHVGNLDDCDDTRRDVRPGGVERCDSLDNDCDGEVDVGATDGRTWFADVDGDGAGDAAVTEVACVVPDGFAARGDDCDDDDATAAPGLDELCDDVDNDCDASVDEDASDAPVWWEDVDGDGFAGDDASVVACVAPVEGSWVLEGGALDCDDGDVEVEACAVASDGGCNGTGTSRVPWVVSLVALLAVRRRSVAA